MNQMTDKERLEEIKKQIKLLRGDMSVTSIEVDIDADIILDDMEWLIEQADRVKELEQKVRVDSELFDKQVQQNKRYREILESLSKTRNIPAKIMKEQPDKKIIDANDLLQYILRKINDELERGTE